VTPLVDDHHRLLLGPAAASAWDRRMADLPPADRTSIGALCGQADLDAALARIHDDLPPGGRFVFVEHIGHPGLLGGLQRAWSTSTARLPWGCRSGRDVPAAVRRAGFHLTDLERFTMPTPVPVLRSWVSGIAVKPSA
jgi:hypothetical protein